MAIHIYNEYRDAYLLSKYEMTMAKVHYKYKVGSDYTYLQITELIQAFKVDFNVEVSQDRINLSRDKEDIAYITFIPPLIIDKE